MRRFRVAAAAVGLAVVSSATGAYANHVFTDVKDGDAHAEAIDWARASGITLGCDENGNFCPSETVTRAQMVTFLHRLSGADPDTAPVVDAAKIDGLTAEDLHGEVSAADFGYGDRVDLQSQIYTDLAVLTITVPPGPAHHVMTSGQATFASPSGQLTAYLRLVVDGVATDAYVDTLGVDSNSSSWASVIPISQVLQLEPGEHVIKVQAQYYKADGAAELVRVHRRAFSAIDLGPVT